MEKMLGEVMRWEGGGPVTSAQPLNFQGRVWALLFGVHSPAAAAWTCSGEDDSEIWKEAMVISLQDQRLH